MSLRTRARLARWAADVADRRHRDQYLRNDLQSRCDHANDILKTNIGPDDLRCTYRSEKDILPSRTEFTVDGIRFVVTRQHEGYDNLGGGVFCRLYLAEDYETRSHGLSSYEIHSLADLDLLLDR